MARTQCGLAGGLLLWQTSNQWGRTSGGLHLSWLVKLCEGWFLLGLSFNPLFKFSLDMVFEALSFTDHIKVNYNSHLPLHFCHIHPVHKKNLLLLGQIQRVRSVLKSACSDDFKSVLTFEIYFWNYRVSQRKVVSCRWNFFVTPCRSGDNVGYRHQGSFSVLT